MNCSSYDIKSMLFANITKVSEISIVHHSPMAGEIYLIEIIDEAQSGLCIMS